jgi:hypothetical protein
VFRRRLNDLINQGNVFTYHDEVLAVIPSAIVAVIKRQRVNEGV